MHPTCNVPRSLLRLDITSRIDRRPSERTAPFGISSEQPNDRDEGSSRSVESNPITLIDVEFSSRASQHYPRNEATTSNRETPSQSPPDPQTCRPLSGVIVWAD
jgi:hypothetical protein